MNIGFIPVGAELPIVHKKTLFEQIIALVSGTMTEPELYGWFHILCLIVVGILCALVVANRHKVTEKSMRLTVGLTGATLLAFEIYKQLVFSYTPDTDTWEYQWYAFPFQFCSTPMYVMTLAALVKKGNFRDCLLAFLATYSLVAGGAVMLYPATVFVETIGINIQTMVHHGSMVVIAIYLLSSGLIKFDLRTILTKALPVFGALVGVALILNLLFMQFGDDSTFNMFFLAPGQGYLLPFLEAIFDGLPYPVYLFSYIFFFSIAAYLVILSARGIVRLHQTVKEKSVSQR